MEQAKQDIKRITSDLSGFAKSVSFVSKDGIQTATINGIHSKIHMGMNTEGEMVNVKKAHISFSESALNGQGYVTRDAENRVNIKGDLVTVVDSNGLAIQYQIDQIYPDDTVGLIVCLLGDYEA